MKRDSLLLLTTLFLFLFLPSCSSKKDSSLKAAGVVEGDVLILRTQVAGTLLSLSFQEGDRIEGDRPLGKLEDLKVKNLLEQVEISRQEVAINRERLLKKRELLLAQKRYLARQEATLPADGRGGRLRRELGEGRTPTQGGRDNPLRHGEGSCGPSGSGESPGQQEGGP